MADASPTSQTFPSFKNLFLRCRCRQCMYWYCRSYYNFYRRFYGRSYRRFYLGIDLFQRTRR